MESSLVKVYREAYIFSTLLLDLVLNCSLDAKSAYQASWTLLRQVAERAHRIYYLTLRDYYVYDESDIDWRTVNYLANKILEESNWFESGYRYAKTLRDYFPEGDLTVVHLKIRESYSEHIKLELELILKLRKGKRTVSQQGDVKPPLLLHDCFPVLTGDQLCGILKREVGKLVSDSEAEGLYFSLIVRFAPLLRIVDQLFGVFSEFRQVRKWLVSNRRVYEFSRKRTAFVSLIAGRLLTLLPILTCSSYMEAIQCLCAPTIMTHIHLENLHPLLQPIYVVTLTLIALFSMRESGCRLLPIQRRRFRIYLWTYPASIRSRHESCIHLRDVLHSLGLLILPSRLVANVGLGVNSHLRIGKWRHSCLILVTCPTLLVDILRTYAKFARFDMFRTGILVSLLELLTERLRECRVSSK